MATETLQDFVQNIISNLKKNGFPEKRVALPLEKMYEIAYQKGLNFNKALACLDDLNIAHEKTTQKVIFFPKPSSQPARPPSAADQARSGINEAMTGNMTGNTTGTVSDMMAEAKRVVDAMSPDERQNLMTMFQNMSPEQQAEILKKAKEMGLG